MPTTTKQQFIDAVARGLAQQGTLGTRGYIVYDGKRCAIGCAAKVLNVRTFAAQAVCRDAGGDAFAASIAAAHDDECRRVGNRGPLDGFWPRLRKICRWFNVAVPAEAR